jgi:hypothetical protein
MGRNHDAQKLHHGFGNGGRGGGVRRMARTRKTIDTVRTTSPSGKMNKPAAVAMRLFPISRESCLGSATPDFPSVSNARIMLTPVKRKPQRGPSASSAPITIPTMDRRLAFMLLGHCIRRFSSRKGCHFSSSEFSNIFCTSSKCFRNAARSRYSPIGNLWASKIAASATRSTFLAAPFGAM